MSKMKRLVKKAMMATEYGCKPFYIRERYGHARCLGQPTGSKWQYLLTNLPQTKIFMGDDSSVCLSKMFAWLPISVHPEHVFFYNIVDNVSWKHEKMLMGNITLDYMLILDHSLQDLHMMGQDDYAARNNRLMAAIEQYAERAADAIEQYGDSTLLRAVASLRGLIDRKANGLYDAMQRVLFINQLLWQTGHMLNGLGSLDVLFAPYYERDIASGCLTRDAARDLIKAFCMTLHEYYTFKSAALMGDTGQIILLGGTREDGSYRHNDLTELFIEALTELKLPDPKIMLKVNRQIPDHILELAMDCMATGIGSPLFANDEVIIPQMERFGYHHEDALRYGVAACWEPLVPGASCDQNNVGCINYTQPLQAVLDAATQQDFLTFDDVLHTYTEHLRSYVSVILDNLQSFDWNEDILFSTFISDCRAKRKDIAEGGARYNNLGILSVGMGSTVNSLLNIKRLVYEQHAYSLQDCREAVIHDFAGYEKLQSDLSNAPHKYGMDEADVIDLTRQIAQVTNTCFEGHQTPLGGKFKFGLSSPNYLESGETTGATLDGRKAGQAFTPHISCEDGIPYTELLQFAGQMDYTEYRFNGNVVDFIVSPIMLRKNHQQFLLFLRKSVEVGFFEMQMNVVDSATLIAAKKNPEKFPNLIVRVWGFSAYFKDLPESYKDLLIERALRAERAA